MVLYFLYVFRKMPEIGETETTLIVVLVFSGFFGAAVAMELGMLMWKFRNRYWMKCRWTEKGILSITGVAVFYSLIRPAHMWDFTRVGDRGISNISSLTLLIVNQITNFIAISAINFFALVCTLRVWHQYFEANVAVKIGIAEWRSMIDDSLVTDEMSWFIRNKSTLGSWKYL